MANQTVRVTKNGVTKSVQKSVLGQYITAGWTEARQTKVASASSPSASASASAQAQSPRIGVQRR